MQKYVGTYRVHQTQDDNGEFTDNHDDTYIKCKNGMVVYRYNDEILALEIPKSPTANKMKDELWDYLTELTKSEITYDIEQSSQGSLSGENVFYFYEKFMDEVAKVIIPKTQGKGMNPRSKRNKKNYIPYEPKNQELLDQFIEKMKVIVEQNGNNISLYMKVYKWLESRLEKNIIELAKEEEIKTLYALDMLGITGECIELLDEFKVLVENGSV